MHLCLYDLYVYQSGMGRDGIDILLADELARVFFFFSAICLDLEDLMYSC
jgi:hypothetical protein